MSRRRLTRLVQTRQQQRDQAAESYNRERQRLACVKQQQAQLAESHRKRLRSSGGAGRGAAPMSALDLEMMDYARRNADKAAEVGEQTVEQARQVVQKSQVKLRQMEVLRDRQRDKQRVEAKRREQRALEQSGRGSHSNKLLGLLICLLVGSDSGCRQLQAATTPPAPKLEASDKKAEESVADPVPQKKCADEKFTAAELRLLRKLRQRAQRLHDQEVKLKERHEKLAALKQAADQTLTELRRIQNKLLGKPAKRRTKQVDSKKQRFVDLVQVVRLMNVRAAAAMMAEMNPADSARVLGVLSAEHAGRLLAQLPSETAGEVAGQLQRLKGRQVPRAASRKKPSVAAAKAAGRDASGGQGAEGEPAAAEPTAAGKSAATSVEHSSKAELPSGGNNAQSE